MASLPGLGGVGARGTRKRRSGLAYVRRSESPRATPDHTVGHGRSLRGRRAVIAPNTVTVVFNCRAPQTVIDLLGYELASGIGGSRVEARFEFGLPRARCCAVPGFPEPEASSRPAARRRTRHHARARGVEGVCGVRVQTRLSSMIDLSAALLEEPRSQPVALPPGCRANLRSG
jgi:hypothetical protein